MSADASVYALFKPADLSEAYQKGLEIKENRARLSDLARQRQKQDALENAYSKNISSDGVINKQGLMSDLAKAGLGKESLELKSGFDAQDMEAQKRKVDLFQRQMDIVGPGMDALAGMSAQERVVAYPKMRQQYIAQGLIDPKDSPEQYDDGYFRSAYGQYRQNKGYLDKQKTLAEVDKLQSEALKNRNEAERNAKNNVMELAGKLRQERSGLPTTKATQDVAAAYNRVQEASKAPSAAGDLSLIFGFMKMLDPGSTVREGEFANAQNAAGVPVQVANLYNRLKSGERLSSEQRADFLSQARGLYSAQSSQQKKIDDYYKRLASKQGVDAGDVLVNFEANEPQGERQLAKPIHSSGFGAIKEAIAAPPTIKHGTVEDGYIFMGGDPANQKSWKKAR